MEGDQDEQQHGDEPQQEQEERPERRQRRDAQAAGPPQELHNLLRILARQRVVLAERARAATNADLIAALRESGMLTRCGCSPAHKQRHRLNEHTLSPAQQPVCVHSEQQLQPCISHSLNCFGSLIRQHVTQECHPLTINSLQRGCGGRNACGATRRLCADRAQVTFRLTSARTILCSRDAMA
jgi:hypothetical protein